jgi:hypothetical protein
MDEIGYDHSTTESVYSIARRIFFVKKCIVLRPFRWKRMYVCDEVLGKMMMMFAVVFVVGCKNIIIRRR